MIDDKTKQEILDSIDLEGQSELSNIRINDNINHVVSYSSGLPRLQSNVINKFKLILSQPERLRHHSNFEIRCVLCKRVISYPAWYYRLRYAVNEFHYFVCFSEHSPLKPNAQCIKE